MRILMILIADADGWPSAPAPVLRFERFLEPYYLFLDAGADVVLASLHGGDPSMRTAAGERADSTPIMRRFQRDPAARDALIDTLALHQVHPEDFDGAYGLGVSGRIWPPNIDNPAGAMIGALLAAGKPVAVVPTRIDMEPQGAGDGLLIFGDRASGPVLAAQALLGAMAKAP